MVVRGAERSKTILHALFLPHQHPTNTLAITLHRNLETCALTLILKCTPTIKVDCSDMKDLNSGK